MYILGRTGCGKTTLLKHLILSDIRNGRGLALIDPHGDLAQSVADTIPAYRMDDTLYFNPLDSHVVSFSPLSFRSSAIHRATLASHVVASFKHVWADSYGPRTEYILKNALRLLLDTPGSTLLDLPRLLIDDHFRQRLLDHCEDEYVKAFWTDEFMGWDPRYRKEAIGPVQNKAGQFATDPILRAVVGHKSAFNPREVMDHGKILLCNFSKAMGEEPSHLLGAFLVTAFYQAAASRADSSEEEREDFTLYIDEFQNFSTDTFATILSEARKYRLNLVVAHQFLGQISDYLRQSVIGNVGTLVVFRIGAEDAPLLARELGTDPTALTDTTSFEAWLKRSEVVPVRIPPPAPELGTFEAVRAYTRARYGRPRA